jgi:hypothetical protein
MKLIKLKKITVLIIIAGLLTLILGGCAPAAAIRDSIQRLFGGKPPVSTDVTGPDATGSETSADSGETGGESTEPMPTTEEPEGNEMVKVSRQLDPLLWEVGEKIYYIDLNSRSLICRYDLEENEPADEPAASPGTMTLTDQVDAIIGFSAERVFCLSHNGSLGSGLPIYDVVAVGLDGTGRTILAANVNNSAVLDDQWLVVSRFGQPFSISIIDLENNEEHLVFEDDGNIYPGMTETDYALGCRFEPMEDGLRIDVEYPGYSEFAYVRYLLLRDGEIAEDSKIAPWQDGTGQMLFEQGMYTRLMRFKNYDDLVIYEQTETDGNTILVYDHPDLSQTLIEGYDYYVMDFFYHQGKVLVPVFQMNTGDAQEASQVMIFDPATEQKTMIDDRYSAYFQFEDKLAALRIERSGETANNVTGRFVVDLLDGSGQTTGNLFDQVLTTGSVYGDVSYKAWRAGHDLVIYYQTHEPDVGEITSTAHHWIFLNLRG